MTSNPPKYFRASTGRGADRVERNSGRYGFGVIQGVSVITRGEALGHALWIDSEFLSDVAEYGNRSNLGVKARFTHPGLSSDGVGSKLGKFHNFSVSGDQVYADLHFQEAATKTPDGDLADYVMTLAEETPEDFGLSIVFEHDLAAMESYIADNSVTQGGRSIFTSPDEDNKDNFNHARLARLRAADVVDFPAANPDGLFKRGQDWAKEGDELISYALGLTDAKPDTSWLNIDGDRAQQFLLRFLKRHNLSIQKGGDSVSDDNPEVVETSPGREEFAAELDRYVSVFGAENGTQWFSKNVSFEDAQGHHIEELSKQIAVRDAKIEELQETLNSLNRGEDEGGEFSGSEPNDNDRTLTGAIRINGKSQNN